MSSLTIAVTGGSGFIGSRVVEGLLRMRRDVRILDIAQPIGNGTAETVSADIRLLNSTKSSLKGVDTVYHLAGPVLEAVRSQPYLGTELNTLGTLNVLEGCRANDVGKILFASSFYVYDGIDPNVTVNENSPLNGNDMELFSASKLLGENLVRTYGQKYGIEYVILRFGSAYGSGNCSNIVKTFLEDGMNDREAIVWGQGQRKNQYTFVDDIAQGCVLSIDQVNQIFNIISPEQTSVKELATIAQEECGLRVTFDAARKEGSSMPYMSSEKIQDRLGWKPTSLREGILRTLDEMTKEPSSQSQISAMSAN